MTSAILDGTLRRIRDYQELTPEQTLKLASALANESTESYESARRLRHIAERQPWAIEWLELWNAVHTNPKDTIATFAWALSTTTDLAYILQDRISPETFTLLTASWKEIVR